MGISFFAERHNLGSTHTEPSIKSINKTLQSIIYLREDSPVAFSRYYYAITQCGWLGFSKRKIWINMVSTVDKKFSGWFFSFQSTYIGWLVEHSYSLEH